MTEPAADPAGSFARLTRVLSLLCLAVVGLPAYKIFVIDGRSPSDLDIFRRLTVAQDFPAAAAVLAVAALAPLLARDGTRVAAAVGRRPGLAAAATAAACAAGAVWVYHAYPLCMDEYMPVFQSRAFARGRLAESYPPEWVEWLFDPNNRALFAATSSETGRAASRYWPGFALLLTPFSLLGVPWLLNPLLAGAGVWLAARAARQVVDTPEAAGWAVLLAVASPAFLVYGVSFYSWNAHLVLNLGYAVLLARPTAARCLAAGVLGSLALVLHNPFPHAAFAAPWALGLLGTRPGRLRFAALAAGYVPVALLMGPCWLRFLAGVLPPTTEGQPMAQTLALGFALPGADALTVRALWLAKLWLWAVPGLPLLAGVGARAGWADPVARRWALSAVLTFAAYLPVTFDQGHGWGYRYFHSAWAALPVLAAVALARPGGGRLGRVVFPLAAASLLLLVPLRAVQVERFIAAHLAWLPPAGEGEGWPVVFFDPDRVPYGCDLIQHDQSLGRPPWVLMSHGPEADRAFARGLDPAARLVAVGDRWSVWRVDAALLRRRVP